ncbi:MAG: SDR family oxidoreductase [Fimbriimonadaceae bacterium]|nr:SDR family oxidoreductase [Fimbriimonadaceae bacterium]QYK55191.1 MAG: SDR family oxidoreductase [Fimbriimonadaceae bacterium]
MGDQPRTSGPNHKGSGKLEGRKAIVSGGDSGIGRAIAIAFAREGADVAILYHSHDEDAEECLRLIEEEGAKGISIKGDIGDPSFCEQAVQQTLEELGGLDVLVNNASEQHPQAKLEDITPEQLERTFRTNAFGYFYLTKAALPHLVEGSTIVNTTSVTAYKGSPELLDYSATKGAELAFTRSLAISLAERKIRVNAVAPGPIWTPLIPSTFEKEDVESFGKDTLLGRPGQPDEVAPCYVFLASNDSSYMTGQTLHPNGGTVVNG